MLHSIRVTIVLSLFVVPGPSVFSADLAAWFPPKTRMFAAFDHFSTSKEKFDASGMGRLWSSDAMREFRKQFEKSDNNPTTKVKNTYGIDVDLLLQSNIQRLAVGAIEVADDELSYSFLLEVDETEARRLVAAGKEHLLSRGGKQTAYDFSLPADVITQVDGEQVVYATHGGFLLISGDVRAAEQIMALWSADKQDRSSLALDPVFQVTTTRKQDTDPLGEMIWFANPIRLAVTTEQRDPEAQPDPRGPFATRHGFAGLEGIGGRVSLMDNGIEFLSTFRVFAPQRNDALRTLDFEAGDVDPPPFVAAQSSNALTIRWNLHSIVSNIGDVYDDVTDAEGAWDAMLKEWQEDLDFDLVGGLAPLLGSKVTVVAEYSPANQLERSVTSIPLKNPDSETEAAKQIWRLLRNNEDKARRARVPRFPQILWKLRFVDKKGNAAFREAGLMVADGRLWIATHATMITDILLRTNEPPLSQDADFQQSTVKLSKWIGDQTFARSFVRSDLDIQTTYQAMRRGGLAELKETENLYSRLLLAVLSDEDGETDVELDFSGLPPFETIREYFGIGAGVANIDPTGWSGVLMSYPK